MEIIKIFFKIVTLIGIACNQSANCTSDQAENSDTGTAAKDFASAVDSLNDTIGNPDKGIFGKLDTEDLTYWHSREFVQNTVMLP